MPTTQGSVALLGDPVAQRILQSRVPARFAYVWPDGTPRVVPINFHWSGEEVVLGTPIDAPKVRALQQNSRVAITIDTETFPANVLLIRGTATLAIMDEVPTEYIAAAKRYLGEEAGAAIGQQMGALVKRWVRIGIRPEWVGIIDFQQRWPSAIEKAMAAAHAQHAPAAPG